ncbi:Iron-sulfur assembly protein 1 [Diatrype stigma]|uniref:Iron-sulfur assembly protein 1 n=1 Tax=Diatrype stigma TaxID=117547 RepID=A0AAN9UAU0_9PEZI
MALTAQEKVQTTTTPPSYQPYPLNTRPPTSPRNDPLPSETSIAGPVPEVHQTRPPPAQQPQTTPPPQASSETAATPPSPQQQPSSAAAATGETGPATTGTTTAPAATATAVPEGEAQETKAAPAKAAPPRRKLRPRKAALKLTPAAVAQLRARLDLPKPQYIKIGVRNRGCSGLAYHLEYVDKPGPFDEAVDQDGVKVLIDSKALFSIIGSEMDWVEDKLNERFTFNNPNISE